MTSRPLPVILSLPHGGLATPAEVVANLAIDATTIYNECDLWVDQLYDFAHADLAGFVPDGYTAGTIATVSLPMARVLIDANRDPNTLSNPDGPVKTQTSYGQPIYQQAIDEVTQQQLLDKYWQPYHQTLEAVRHKQAEKAKLLLDCHNMAQHSPAAYDFPGAARPFICLANLGDQQGEPLSQMGWTTCSAELLRESGRIAETLFADLALLEPVAGENVPIVALNWPFVGGYIIERYSQATLTRPQIPTIMIEVNRGLFVGDQRTDTPIKPPNLAQIAKIRQRLYQWAAQVAMLLSER